MAIIRRSFDSSSTSLSATISYLEEDFSKIGCTYSQTDYELSAFSYTGYSYSSTKSNTLFNNLLVLRVAAIP